MVLANLNITIQREKEEKDERDIIYGRHSILLFIVILSMVTISILFVSPVSALGDYKFDIAANVGGVDNYTKHWSNIYPPDPRANIIVYTFADNLSFKRMSGLGFVYVTYDPKGIPVAVNRTDVFKRNYDPSVVYYILHPKIDWIEGEYKIRIIVYNKIDREEEAWEDITTDPYGIAQDVEKYKEFYETGGNAEDLGILRDLGDPVGAGTLYFNIDKSVTIYPPDRFLLHDVRFIDDKTERILGEQLKVEVKVDNNYVEDGSFKLALLVDNSIVSTQDVSVKGKSTSTITFEAKAGKLGEFKLHFGADTPDVKFRDAELTFSIKNESETTRLDVPRFEIKSMNIDKEFVPSGSSVIVSVGVVNNGKAGNKTVTIYSNRIPVGSADVTLQYLEEMTIDIPIVLKDMGINKITVSDAPQLYRNVFVQEAEVQKSVIQKRLEENPIKVSAVVVFLIFAVVLYFLRKKLFK